MRHKATFAVGLTTGYVLGARAGHTRYEQIARLVRGLADNPAIQSTAGLLQAQAADLAGVAKRRARDKVAETVGGREVTDELPPYPPSDGPLR
ncbi:MAG TPA: hypothetical protein VNG13_13080 [Mycobacteriales bacterium]|nr:hypothetical protein [Mycobacteriales bacterium]